MLATCRRTLASCSTLKIDIRHLQVGTFTVKQDKSPRGIHYEETWPRSSPRHPKLEVFGTSTYEPETRAIFTPGSGSAFRIRIRIQQLKLIRLFSKSGSETLFWFVFNLQARIPWAWGRTVLRLWDEKRRKCADRSLSLAPPLEEPRNKNKN